MKKVFALLVVALCVVGASAEKDRLTTVYMFGVATTFNDSTVVITDIQAIDSAFVSQENVLSERAIYSYQLETYLENSMARPYATCAVFWSTKRKTVERQLMKVQRRFSKDKTTHLLPLALDEFAFTVVEHIVE